VAGSSGLIKVGLIAGAAYLAYRQGWLSMLGIGAPTAAAAAPAAASPAAPATPVNPITGANTLDGIYQRMIASAGSISQGVDAWNSYLATAGNLTPPDPMPIFTAAVPGFDRSQLLTGPQYWAVMAPALKSQLGLSGLGFYGGLGAIARYR
jgi:hypothetical protein